MSEMSYEDALGLPAPAYQTVGTSRSGAVTIEVPVHGQPAPSQPDAAPPVPAAPQTTASPTQPGAQEIPYEQVIGAGAAPGAPDSPQDSRPVSQGLGLEEGFHTIGKNLVDLLSGGMPGLPQNTIAKAGAAAMTLPFRMALGADDANIARQQQTQAPGLVGKVAGMVLGGAPFGIDELGAIPLGMMQGALSSDSSNSDPLGKLKDLATGAVAGKLGDLAIGGVKNVISPIVRPAAQWALDNGIRLPTGGILGGFAKKMEEGASKGTIAGPMVGAAQRQAIGDFNLSTIQNKVLAPAGLSLPSDTPVFTPAASRVAPGTDAVNHATTALGNAYDALTPNLVLNKDTGLIAAAKAAQQAATTLPTAYKTRLGNFANQILADPNAPITGDSVQDLTSTLRQESADAHRSGDFFTAPYGRALDDLSGAVSDALERSNPDYAQQLRGLNQGYAALVRVQRASTNAVQDDGVFTPKGLLAAVRGSDQSVRDNATARGQALLQDWANSGKEVLPDKLPTTGSIWSHLPELAVTLGVGHEAGLPGVAGMLGAEGLGALAYTPTGQKMATAALTQRPQVMRNIGDIMKELKGVGAFAGGVGGPLMLPSPTQAQPAASSR